MPDRNNSSEDIDKKDDRIKIELFDPREQRFKFKPRSWLH